MLRTSSKSSRKRGTLARSVCTSLGSIRDPEGSSRPSHSWGMQSSLQMVIYEWKEFSHMLNDCTKLKNKGDVDD